MTLNTNAKNTGVLNVDHVDVKGINHLVESVTEVPAEILWTRKFLAAQGFDNRGPIIHQDNQSAMLLEKHGNSSSRKQARHIDVRYCYISDCVA